MFICYGLAFGFSLAIVNEARSPSLDNGGFIPDPEREHHLPCPKVALSNNIYILTVRHTLIFVRHTSRSITQLRNVSRFPYKVHVPTS